MNVVIHRIAAVTVGLVAPLVLLAPVAQATSDSRCSTVIETLRQCQPDSRDLFNGPSRVEFPVGFPGLGYEG